MADIGLSISWLDLKKSNWRKKGFDCWDMGLRIIGTKAFWDPIVFTKWLFEYECKNKPTNNLTLAFSMAASHSSSQARGGG